MRPPRWIWWIAISVALVLLMAYCSASGGGAEAATLPKAAQVLQGPETFSARGSQIASRSTGQCWRWTPSWYTYNAYGIKTMRYGLDVEWCASTDGTRVSKLVYNFCYDNGSKFTYDGCKRQRGSLGYASLGMYTEWHYHMGFPSIDVVVYYKPHVRFDLYPNGGITGTVYYS